MKENREQLRLLIGQASQRLHEFWERADRTRLLVILGLVGMGIILCSELLPSGATGQEVEQLSGEEVCGQSDSERYVRSIEERLTQILSQIDGAGECSVMVTLRESSRSVYASEDKSTTQTSQGQQNTQNTSSSEQKLVLVESRDGQSSPVIEKIVEPQIGGVIVVCEGGGSAQVQSQVIEAVTTVLGIRSTQVCVSPKDR